MANYKHGLYITEETTALTPPSEVGNVTIAIGTAPLHLATNPAGIYKPILCTKMSEFAEAFGMSTDFEKYTLCEAAYSAFSLYNVAPVAFINVLDKNKHYALKDEDFENVTKAGALLKGDVYGNTVIVTSGEYIAPVELELETDYEIEEIEYDDSDSDNVIEAATVFKIINGDAIVDNKVNISYRLSHSALGGEAIESEITVTGTSFNLPTDTVVASVVAKTGGVNTLVGLEEDVDYSLEVMDGFALITILSDARVENDSINVLYHVVDIDKVSDNDVIGGFDAEGRATGIELVDSVYPKFNLVAGSIIAPKYSTSLSVAAALAAKASSVSGIFKAQAIADLSTKEYKTYGEAISGKTLSNEHLIICWPKVSLAGQQYHLSTQLANLMNYIDSQSDDIPYRSPSNQALRIDQAVLADGTEKYLTQEQANLLNGAGITTALNFGSWKLWGNENSVYPVSSDVKDRYIATRRMLNYLESRFVTMFLSRLDYPLTRRMIEAVITSTNNWLNSLTSAGAILGAQISLDESLETTDLLEGHLKFRLEYAAPPPAKAISVTFAYNTDYLKQLLG